MESGEDARDQICVERLNVSVCDKASLPDQGLLFLHRRSLCKACEAPNRNEEWSQDMSCLIVRDKGNSTRAATSMDNVGSCDVSLKGMLFIHLRIMLYSIQMFIESAARRGDASVVTLSCSAHILTNIRLSSLNRISSSKLAARMGEHPAKIMAPVNDPPDAETIADAIGVPNKQPFFFVFFTVRPNGLKKSKRSCGQIKGLVISCHQKINQIYETIWRWAHAQRVYRKSCLKTTGRLQ